MIERLDLNDMGHWWPCDSHARYGDVAAYHDVRTNYIYALGGAPNFATSWPDNQYVYQVRVKASQAYDRNAYEYWWGRSIGWRSKPLSTFNATTAVMWGVGQGQIVWSNYFECYIFVHLGMSFFGPLSKKKKLLTSKYIDCNKVALRTAASPEGPWSADVIVYEPKLLGDFAYAGVAHPYLDSTGQTLTISYTNAPNVIEVIKVTFSR